MAKQLVRELISAGVHFGHGTSRWNPKMAPFIFGKRGNIHIIDIKKTLKGLLIAKKLLVEVVASGKDVIFVGTKRQAKEAVERTARECGMHFVTNRWLGGTLTNFRTIRSRLQRLEQLEAMEADGTLDSESKKRASRLKRELRKIKANLEGIRNLNRLPGAVVVVDARKEYLAVREAGKLGIATIGIIDTDSDPDTVDVAIPANDDSIRGIELILSELGQAVAIGKTRAAVQQQEMPKRPRRARSRRPALARADAGEASPPAGPADSGSSEEAQPPSQQPEKPAAGPVAGPQQPEPPAEAGSQGEQPPQQPQQQTETAQTEDAGG